LSHDGVNRSEEDLARKYEEQLCAAADEEKLLQDVIERPTFDRAIMLLRNIAEGGVKKLQAKMEAGDPLSQYLVAIGHLKGFQFIQDEQLAFEGFRKAADQNYAPAIRALGLFYEKGRACQKSHQRAVELFRTAIAGGDLPAIADLGYCFYRGNGLEQSVLKAYELFEQGASKGDAQAMTWIGVCHSHSTGITAQHTPIARNVELAREWFLRSAEAGYAHAWYYLGNMYEYPASIAQNSAKAYLCWKMGAHFRNSHCQFEIGRLYHDGRGGVQRSDEQARKWYERAAGKTTTQVG
jgi:TPR repeat protein